MLRTLLVESANSGMFLEAESRASAAAARAADVARSMAAVWRAHSSLCRCW